jgi:hypothetical protein
METYKAKRARSKDKPIVMAVKNAKTGHSLIVAVLGPAREAGYVRK